MKKGQNKSQHKYKSKKFVNGKWVYFYGNDKLSFTKDDGKPKAINGKPKVQLKDPKIKIIDYYGKGRHKYFKNTEDKKDFLSKQKLGFTGGKGKKIKSTMGRIKIGTNVEISVGGHKYKGKVIDNNGTKSRSPTRFDVEYYDSKNKKTFIKKNIPREDISRISKSYQQKKEEKKTKKDIKKDIFREEGNELIERNIEIDPQTQAKAKELVGSNWEMFSKIASKYWRTRLDSGWDASKFGFDYEDMKQEVFLTIYRAALSYVSNPRKDGRATFKSYVYGFLKANMAATLAVNSGAGGHLKASAKDQIYLWFFKTTKDQFKDAHSGKEPSDIEMMDLLNKRRKELEDIKGNKTIKQYDWTIEKVRNKNSMSKRMESLDKIINLGDVRSDTLLSVLNDDELEIAGHYKSDPWKQAQKVIVREEVRKAIRKKFDNRVDRAILIRSYGLFVNEDSPIKERIYAQGSTTGEISLLLNRIENKKGTKIRWTPDRVDNRLAELLNKLREDPDFKKRMESFIKSKLDGENEWPAAGLILYWIAIHDIVDKTINEVLQNEIIHETAEEMKTRKAAFIIDKKYGGEDNEGSVKEENKRFSFVRNKYVE
jgi:hypothetical protein